MEYTSVVFQEEENAFGKGKEEQTDAMEFPEQTEKIHVIEDSPNPQGKSKRKGFLPPCPYPDQCSEEKMPEEYLSMRWKRKYPSGKKDAFL